MPSGRGYLYDSLSPAWCSLRGVVWRALVFPGDFVISVFCWLFCVVFYVGVCVNGLGCQIERSSLRRILRRCNAIRSIGLVVSHSAHHSGNFTFTRLPGRGRTEGTVRRLGNTRCRNHRVIMGRTAPEHWWVVTSGCAGKSVSGVLCPHSSFVPFWLLHLCLGLWWVGDLLGVSYLHVDLYLLFYLTNASFVCALCTRVPSHIFGASFRVSPRGGKRLSIRFSGLDFFGSSRCANSFVGNCALPKL